VLKGYGFTGWVDTTGKLWLGRPSGIDMAADLKTREVPGYPHNNPTGLMQIVDAAVIQETFNCVIDTGSFDKYEIARVFDQQIALTSSISLPVTQTVVVPASAPYQVTIAGLVANQQLGAFAESTTDSLQLVQTTTTSPPAGRYKVNADTVLFNAAQAGRSVVVQYFKAYTDVETLGVEPTVELGELIFFGRLIGPRFTVGPLFYIPRLVRFSGFSSGGETTKVTYRALLQPPYSKPIVFAFGVPFS